MDSPDYEDRFGQRTKMERNKSDFGMKPPSRIPDGLRNYMNTSMSTQDGGLPMVRIHRNMVNETKLWNPYTNTEGKSLGRGNA